MSAVGLTASDSVLPGRYRVRPSRKCEGRGGGTTTRGGAGLEGSRSPFSTGAFPIKTLALQTKCATAGLPSSADPNSKNRNTAAEADSAKRTSTHPQRITTSPSLGRVTAEEKQRREGDRATNVATLNKAFRATALPGVEIGRFQHRKDRFHLERTAKAS